MGKQIAKTGFYLSRISATYQPKNNFHKEVKARIELYDRLVLTDPAAFIADLRVFVSKIHHKHPRAGAMEFNINRDHEKEDPAFSIGGIIHFELDTIKGGWTKNGINPFIPFDGYATGK